MSESRLNLSLTEEPSTFKIQRSSVLADVKSFLPQLKSANEKLFKDIADSNDPNQFNVEETSQCEGKIIEMDIALFEDNNSDEEDNQSDCSDSSHDNEDDGAFTEITEKSLKLHKSDEKRTKVKPQIVDITEKTNRT